MSETEADARAAYMRRLDEEKLDRADLLRLLRAGGIAAARLTSDAALRDLLWRAFGRRAWERYHAE